MHNVKVAQVSLKSNRVWLRYEKNKYTKYIKPQTVSPCMLGCAKKMKKKMTASYNILRLKVLPWKPVEEQ